MSDCNGSLELGIVVGPTKPDQITFEARRPVSLGEYVMILSSQQKKILGVIESSSIKSDALSDNISNFQEAMESKQVASKNKRDKSYKANVKILGLLEELKKCKTILPEIPPIPGTEVLETKPDELKSIFDPTNDEWLRIGTLLRQKDVDVKININKVATRHLGILAMTGMGKSNVVTLIAKAVSEIPGTMVIFDYHDDYKGLRIRNANLIPAKINPRLLSADKFADVIEIRDIADIQKTILSKAFDDDLKKRTGDDFWQTLEENIKNLEQIEKRNKSSAERVRDKVKEAHRRLSNILQADAADPVAMIKEGKINIISLLELNEKQANIAISFYLESLLSDRKNAKNQMHSEGSGGFVRFKSPMIVVIEEAHVFIPKQEYTDTKYFAAKVAREGRKFGVGLIVVSQRPRSIDSNVLSQLGSLAIMKVVQQEDQTQIASTSESLTTNLTEQLPSLNPGEALLIGQWVNLPSFAKIDEAKDRWMGADPNPVAEWKSNQLQEEMARESTQSYIREGYVYD
ncbi:MAG: ATP-binding protein [Nitrososphaeraceae archaeon]|jgi:DNA helicase HerA-like ATPase